MLVISRREGQRVQIGNGITITVVRVDPKSVRLGIDAPDDACIMRTELLVRAGEEISVRKKDESSGRLD
jgi:carbon storage regulator